jgi:hypothetical protein
VACKPSPLGHKGHETALGIGRWKQPSDWLRRITAARLRREDSGASGATVCRLAFAHTDRTLNSRLIKMKGRFVAPGAVASSTRAVLLCHDLSQCHVVRSTERLWPPLDRAEATEVHVLWSGLYCEARAPSLSIGLVSEMEQQPRKMQCSISFTPLSICPFGPVRLMRSECQEGHSA